MLIRNTNHEALHAWPEGLFVQGGGSGVVFRKDGTSYGTAFVEVAPGGTPGTFLRGEGHTIAEAEQRAWDKYQVFLNCDGNGAHGPYEARQYENGSGFCTKCGTWFSKVLEPSLEYTLGEVTSASLMAKYGDQILWHHSWRDLYNEEFAIVLAEARGEPVPERTVTPPTEEEMKLLRDEATGEIGAEEFTTAMTAIFENLAKGESDD